MVEMYKVAPLLQVFALPKLLLTFSLFVFLTATLQADDPLEAGFKNPPASAKARTWWHWINGNVTKSGITADLEAMKKVGLQEAQIFSVSLNDPKGPAVYLSPVWLDMFEHAALEAKRLNLELGFHNGPGWSSSGGPWVTPSHAMQTVVFSETFHDGGKPFNGRLPEPSSKLNYYRDIAVLAFPQPKQKLRIDDLDFKTLSKRIRNRLTPDDKPIPAAATINPSDIVNLTNKMSKDGSIKWDAPKGKWVILRIGYTPNGKKNRPGPAGGRGLECDKMSKQAVDAYWKHGIDPIIKKLDGLVGTVVTQCVIDSYEVGATNWTSGFEKSFAQLRGYECIDYLPTLAGYYVGSGEITERFLWDFRRTIGDLIAENYYGQFRRRCHQHGLKLSIEPYWGPFESMQIGAQGDVAMCEFWSGEIAFFDTPKLAASIAKLNGDSIVGAEAFTGLGGWVEHPATIKTIGDRAWAQGINRFIFHSFVHQPWNVGPGLTLSYHGLEFNRLNTWWDSSAAFLNYVARSQFLLQQGNSVADVLIFTGESSPNNAFVRPDIKAAGFDYDLIGTHEIQSLTTENGLIKTSTGGTYRALLLSSPLNPNNSATQTTWLRPVTLRKVFELANAGATILGTKPDKSPSLRGFPACDQVVASLADKLWGTGMIKDTPISQWLRDGNIAPDFDVENESRDGIEFIHRKTKTADIYFVTNFHKQKRQPRLRFRVSGKQPEIWNAETGTLVPASVWQDNGDGTTSVSLDLKAEDAIFVIFRSPEQPTAHIVDTKIQLDPAKPIPPPTLEIVSAQIGTFLPDGLIDVTEILNNQIESNQLDVKASRQLFEFDPAPGYKKELRVKYRIGTAEFEQSVVEQESLRIDAKDKGALKILAAVFGKFSQQLQGVPSDFAAVDVTKAVTKLVANQRYTITARQDLPQSGAIANLNPDSQLRVTYSSAGKLQTRTIPAGRTLNLAADVPASKIDVTPAGTFWSTPLAGRLQYNLSTGSTQSIRVETTPAPIELNDEWAVSFPTTSGINLNLQMDRLTSWPDLEQSKLRYFSGTATYHNEFVIDQNLMQPNTTLELDLGDVRVVAEVFINGRKLRTLWRGPFRIGIDDAIVAGVNKLEIKVTNLWANRLIGDEQLPNDVRRKGKNVKQWPDWLTGQSQRTSGRVSFSAYKHWQADSKLQRSGLLGPVIIRPYVRTKLDH